MFLNFANTLLGVFVVNLKIDAVYAFSLESFCDENLAIRKVLLFVTLHGSVVLDKNLSDVDKFSFLYS